MFLEKYTSEFGYQQILSIYEEDFLTILDENNFKLIYNLFKEQGFYYIEDIIIKYLEIFNMDYNLVKQGLKKLHLLLGENYVLLISHKLDYLNLILDEF